MLGGRLLSSREWIDGLPAVEWVDKAVAELQQMETVQLLPRSTVFGYHDYNYLTINQRLSDHLPLSMRPASREKLWRVRAKRVLLATAPWSAHWCLAIMTVLVSCSPLHSPPIPINMQ